MSSAKSSILEQAKQLQPEIVELRRHLHRHPELSFCETETAKLAAQHLSELGYSVKEKVGKTGVLADIGSAGKLIAIRADMDGLPILESNSHDYASQNKGVMHACGHDAHVSCAIAAAKLLSGKEQLAGRVRMLMQPAEEDTDSAGRSGAYRMIEDGAMDGVNAVIGLHMDASLPAGKVAIMPGPIMAACDGFRLTIIGKGGHGAYPENCIDSVVIAAQIITAVQQIVSRRISAIEPAVITIGSIRSSSSRGNVISDSVVLLGTIRSFSTATRERLREEVERVCSIIRSFGAEYKLEYEIGYPPTVNDRQIAAVMKEVATELIGADNVVELPPKTWSEDFSMLAEVSPGAFMFLGGEMNDYRRSHHSPDFDINENGLFIGSAILAATALRLLEQSE